MAIKGILFDMDGVLFDTERLHIEIDHKLAAEMGYTLPEALTNQLYGCTDTRVGQIMRAFLGQDFNYEYFRDNSWKLTGEHLEAHGMPLKPGVEGLLAWLSAQGIPMAISSSSTREVILQNIRRAGFEAYFEAVVGGDEVSASKPDPEIFLKAAALLGLPPGDCLAIEDSYAGIRSAAGAGCVTVMIPDMLPPTEEIEALCAAVLGSLEEVGEYIREYNRKL